MTRVVLVYVGQCEGLIVNLAVLPECHLLRSSVDIKHSYLNVVCGCVRRLPAFLVGIAVSLAVALQTLLVLC